ncbi:MAG TPA: hypothetical protein VFP39_13455 [Gemmatimonadales bacterium]|nr:hypothetical protein [Gemmatimonadales bacterium]
MRTLPIIFILGTAIGVPPNALAQKLAPLCPNGVKVFYAPSEVGKEFQQVGWLHAKNESGYSDEDMIITIQRREAAHLGANGIIVSGFEEFDAAARAANGGKVRVLDVTVPERGAVLAIYIPDDSSRVQASCKGTNNR